MGKKKEERKISPALSLNMFSDYEESEGAWKKVANNLNAYHPLIRELPQNGM